MNKLIVINHRLFSIRSLKWRLKLQQKINMQQIDDIMQNKNYLNMKKLDWKASLSDFLKS